MEMWGCTRGLSHPNFENSKTCSQTDAFSVIGMRHRECLLSPEPFVSQYLTGAPHTRRHRQQGKTEAEISAFPASIHSPIKSWNELMRFDVSRQEMGPPPAAANLPVARLPGSGSPLACRCQGLSRLRQRCLVPGTAAGCTGPTCRGAGTGAATFT